MTMKNNIFIFILIALTTIQVLSRVEMKNSFPSTKSDKIRDALVTIRTSEELKKNEILPLARFHKNEKVIEPLGGIVSLVTGVISPVGRLSVVNLLERIPIISPVGGIPSIDQIGGVQVVSPLGNVGQVGGVVSPVGGTPVGSPVGGIPVINPVGGIPIVSSAGGIPAVGQVGGIQVVSPIGEVPVVNLPIGGIFFGGLGGII